MFHNVTLWGLVETDSRSLIEITRRQGSSHYDGLAEKAAGDDNLELVEFEGPQLLPRYPSKVAKVTVDTDGKLHVSK